MDAEGTSGAGLTERQKRWLASVAESLPRTTGRGLDEWVAIARACPEVTPRRRQAWLKAEHGLGANYASYVLMRAFPAEGAGWDDPEALRTALWKEPAARATLDALIAAVAGLEGVVVGQRKGYTPFSRQVQFAAARPLRGGRTLLGLKLEAAASPGLAPAARRESWSERLTATVELDGPEAVDDEIVRLLAAAWANG